MKKLLLTLAFLLLASSAQAQKTCVKISNTSQNCSVTLSWPASVVDATHSAATGYVPQRSAGPASPFVDLVAAPIAGLVYQDNIAGDPGNTTYCYDVVSVGAAGRDGPSIAACWTTPVIIITPTLPNPPSNLTLSALSPTQIELRWKDNSNNELGFQAMRTAGASSVLIEFPADLSPAPKSWKTYGIDSGLTAVTRYSYRIRALGDAGSSGWSNQISAMTK